jgi:hypothetical protein
VGTITSPLAQDLETTKRIASTNVIATVANSGQAIKGSAISELPQRHEMNRMVTNTAQVSGLSDTKCHTLYQAK